MASNKLTLSTKMVEEMSAEQIGAELAELSEIRQLALERATELAAALSAQETLEKIEALAADLPVSARKQAATILTAQGIKSGEAVGKSKKA